MQGAEVRINRLFDQIEKQIIQKYDEWTKKEKVRTKNQF
jgi:hypothetical protein